MNKKFQLNNRPITVTVPPDRRVIDLLRDDHGLTGTKEGMRSGECVPARSCERDHQSLVPDARAAA
jgi:aerobic-type carbon monoxide dehydrogenase small subunit (CoxS/CutS family)